jgi:hypothetical protein
MSSCPKFTSGKSLEVFYKEFKEYLSKNSWSNEYFYMRDSSSKDKSVLLKAMQKAKEAMEQMEANEYQKRLEKYETSKEIESAQENAEKKTLPVIAEVAVVTSEADIGTSDITGCSLHADAYKPGCFKCRRISSKRQKLS